MINENYNVLNKLEGLMQKLIFAVTLLQMVEYIKKWLDKYIKPKAEEQCSSTEKESMEDKNEN